MNKKFASKTHPRGTFHEKRSPINEEIVAEIRKRTTEWEAHDVNENPFAGYDAEELDSFVNGVIFDKDAIQPLYENMYPGAALPDNFDPRTEKFS